MTITRVTTENTAAAANRARVAEMSAPVHVKIAESASALERMASEQNAKESDATSTSATSATSATPATPAQAKRDAAKTARESKRATGATVTSAKTPATKTESEQSRLARVAAENKKRTPAQVRADAKAIADARIAKQRATKETKTRTPRATLGALTLGGTKIGGATPRNDSVGYRLLNAPALNTRKAITRDAWLESAGVTSDMPYRQAIAHLRYGMRVLRSFAADGKTEMYIKVADALAYGSDSANVKQALAKRAPVAKVAKQAPATKTAKTATSTSAKRGATATSAKRDATKPAAPRTSKRAATNAK